MVAPGMGGGGHAWLLWGGMCGCSGGPCVVALGGHAWLLWGVRGCSQGHMRGCSGRGVHGCSGGMRGFPGGGMRGFSGGGGVRILLECILVTESFGGMAPLLPESATALVSPLSIMRCGDVCQEVRRPLWDKNRISYIFRVHLVNRCNLSISFHA